MKRVRLVEVGKLDCGAYIETTSGEPGQVVERTHRKALINIEILRGGRWWEFSVRPGLNVWEVAEVN